MMNKRQGETNIKSAQARGTMAKYLCLPCGWVYDEITGDPDNGVPEGTKWEDIPEGWVCPVCFVGKEEFELIEE